MPGIHITDLEAAINYWRGKTPSPDGVTLPRDMEVAQAKNERPVLGNDAGDLVCGVD